MFRSIVLIADDFFVLFISKPRSSIISFIVFFSTVFSSHHLQTVLVWISIAGSLLRVVFWWREVQFHYFPVLQLAFFQVCAPSVATFLTIALGSSIAIAICSFMSQYQVIMLSVSLVVLLWGLWIIVIELSRINHIKSC
jgi:hypothetical protein